MSFDPRFTVTHRVTADLTRIERARGFLEAAALSEDWIHEMGAGALVLEAHHTTHIEGTRLTLEESELLLAGEAVPEADPDDVRELLNYRNAFEFVSTWLGGGGPITEGLVREIHKRLFAVSEYYDRDRAAFYRAIQGVREQDMDLTGWLEFFTAGLATQLDEVKARGERTIRRDALARQHGLSDRQAVALGHVIEHGRLTIHDYEKLCPGANRRTLQRDLRALVEKGLLAEAGTAPTDPTRHYRLAAGFVRSGAEL